MAVRQFLHERDSPATLTATRYYNPQRDTIYLRPLEGNYGEIRNRTKTQYSFPSTNRRADRTDQCHIGTISKSIHQLSTRRLVWLPITCRICVQQQISGDHQKHTLLCKLRNQSRIRDDLSSDSRNANETRRNDSVTCVFKEQDGGRTITRKRIPRFPQKTRSKSTVRGYGVVVAIQHQDHKTIEKVGLQENGTIQNLGKDWDKSI